MSTRIAFGHWLKKTSFFSVVILLLLFILSFMQHPASNLAIPPGTVVWKLETPDAINGIRPEILGAPVIVKEKQGASLSFNGSSDGLIMPVNPVQGFSQFTIEILCNPTADGPKEPRFLHIEDGDGNRATIELRLNKGQWFLDTFLKDGKSNKGLALNDSTKLHPAAQWYWLALSYDGKQMTHYVNGVKELDGAVTMSVMGSGQTSLGVRLNKVNWFKGRIKEVRFHPVVLEAGQMARPLQ